MVHYIPLRKDFSNLDEVLDRLSDVDVRDELTENAHRDLIASGEWSYAASSQRGRQRAQLGRGPARRGRGDRRSRRLERAAGSARDAARLAVDGTRMLGAAAGARAVRLACTRVSPGTATDRTPQRELR